MEFLRTSASASILAYIFLSLALTLHVKVVMQWLGFGLPWLVTSIHSLSCIIGMQLLTILGYYKPMELQTKRQKHILWLYSILFTANIAVSNASLYYVSVPLHQVIRGTVPLFTVLITRLFSGTWYSTNTYATLAPVVLGVTLTTFGDYAAVGITGVLLTVLGALLAALKTVVTNSILVGGLQLKLSALDLLFHLSPLAFTQCFLLAALKGELYIALDYVNAVSLDGSLRVLLLVGGLLINGVVAFLLNIASFTANRKTSALAMTVAGNVKVALTVLSGCLLFSVVLPLSSVVGVLVTLIGGALYSSVRYRESLQKERMGFKTTV
ncbi:hypothetical protein FB639_005079 [Coemansia asiatica]|nr:hypothetical protein FB639_005079 [Coemansia asiatica]